jgi:methylated-DNA-[protein]-cysteine S-methyltransferase
VTVRYAVFPSAIGELLLTGDGHALSGLYFPDGSRALAADPSWIRDDGAFTPVRAELSAYFARELTQFTVPLAAHGTAFQMRVWQALQTIPYGATTTYGRLAADLGDPKLSRAVGLANGSNPIAIIIPCHRVIGADGTLTGYGGGVHRKHWLLALEGRLLDAPDRQQATSPRPPKALRQPLRPASVQLPLLDARASVTSVVA